MPADINLLPDDQRAKEQRELQHRDDTRPGLTYSQPKPVEAAQSPASPAADDKSKKGGGWWNKALNKEDSSPTAAVKPEKPTVVPVPPVVTTAKPAISLAAESVTGKSKRIMAQPAAQPASAPAFKKLGEQLRGLWKKLNTKSGATSEPTGGAVEVNLIPEETTTASKGQVWLLLGVVLGAAVIVAGGFLLLGADITAKQQRSAQAQQQLADTGEQIKQQQKWIAELTVTNEQIKLTQKMLDEHIYWTNFFRWLEAVTLPNVYYSGFMGDVAGKFNLSASAKDYTTLAQQLLLLQGDDQVTAVSVNEASRDSEGWVNFTLSLTVKPSLFLKTSQ